MRERLLKILLENKIDFAEHGKNIGKKAVGINCPFCGDDTGKHLGIMDNYYTCWKNSQHRGSLPNLLSKLLNISLSEAKLMLEKKTFAEDNLLDTINELWYNNAIMTDKKLGGVKELILPKEFHKINDKALSKGFYEYLLLRGFNNLPSLVEKYQLHYCVTGDFSYRLIFPIYYLGKLVTWQGRAISSSATLRYKDLSIEESVRHAKFCLYNFDNLKGGKALFVTEGVFDALKIDFYGKEIDATCIFTTSIRDEQIALLLQVSHLYDKVFICLDKGAEGQALGLLDKLSFIKNVEWYSSLTADDPGSMSKEQVYEMENNLI